MPPAGELSTQAWTYAQQGVVLCDRLGWLPTPGLATEMIIDHLAVSVVLTDAAVVLSSTMGIKYVLS